MKLEAPSVVSLLRLENASVVDQDSGWELWEYGLRDPASQAILPTAFYLLFVKSKGLSPAGLQDIVPRLRKRTRDKQLSVAIQRSSPLSRNPARVKDEVRATVVHLVP